MKTKFLVSKALVGVSLLALVGSASAADRKVFSATSCAEGFDSTPESTIQPGGVFKLGATAETVFCPVVRDNELSTMDVTDWDITVNRNGSAVAWDIVLWSTDTSGLSGWTSTVTVPAAPATGVQNLDGGTITSAHADGVLIIRTSAPASAQIHSFAITES